MLTREEIESALGWLVFLERDTLAVLEHFETSSTEDLVVDIDLGLDHESMS